MSVAVYVALPDAKRRRRARDSLEMEKTGRVVAATIIVIAAAAAGGCGGSDPAAPAPSGEPALVPLTTAQAAQRADRIAVVQARGSRVVEGAPGTPFTRSTFAVQRVLKGALPPTFAVQVIGGRLGNRVVPSIVPPFVRARRYVLFLGPDGPAGPTIFPQSTIEVGGARGPPLGRVLSTIRRSLRTEASS
jgi:hypothetical protein